MSYEYFQWLLSRIHNEKGIHLTMLQYLANRDFVYILDFDQNRYDDGLFLRKEYGEEFDIPCSVLEMLISLAIRLEEEYIGDAKCFQPERIFWEMIKNLGLPGCVVKRIFRRDKADRILHRWMYREFNHDGFYSIFPLRYPNQDQRDVEIWSQAMAYLTENY